MLKNPPIFLFPHFLVHPFTEQNGLASLFAFGPTGGTPVRSVAGCSPSLVGVVALGFQPGAAGCSCLAVSGSGNVAVEGGATLWASARDGVRDGMRPVGVVLVTALPWVVRNTRSVACEDAGSTQRDSASVPLSISAISAFSRITAMSAGMFSRARFRHGVVGPTRLGPLPLAIFDMMVSRSHAGRTAAVMMGTSSSSSGLSTSVSDWVNSRHREM